jgi:putative RecB family exonuclease
MRLYSHSRLSLFEQCPEAFKIKYIDKNFPDLPVSINLFLGKVVHDSLEKLYNKKMLGEIWEMDEMIRHFAMSWKNGFNSEIRVTNGDSKDFFHKGIKFLIDYYQSHKPFLDGTMETEKRIVFPLDETGEVGIQGYVDRIVKRGWDQFEVHDYKTNVMMKKQEEVDADRQLAFYHIGLQKLFGKKLKVKLVWHFLAHNRSMSSTRTQGQLEKLRLDTLKLIGEIESNTVWPACGRQWCDWCDFKKKNGLNIQDNVVIKNGDLKDYF